MARQATYKNPAFNGVSAKEFSFYVPEEGELFKTPGGGLGIVKNNQYYELNQVEDMQKLGARGNTMGELVDNLYQVLGIDKNKLQEFNPTDFQNVGITKGGTLNTSDIQAGLSNVGKFAQKGQIGERNLTGLESPKLITGANGPVDAQGNPINLADYAKYGITDNRQLGIQQTVSGGQQYGQNLTLPNGQIIDYRDPNYDTYARQMGIQQTSSNVNGINTGVNTGASFVGKPINLKNPNIANANPSAIANVNYINALYQEAYGRNATQAELNRFSSSTVKDAANLILGASRSPFSTQGGDNKITVRGQDIDTTGWTQEEINQVKKTQETGQQMVDEGKIINPKVDVKNDTVVNQFLEEAKKRVDPYYQTLFSQTQDDIKRGINRVSEDYTSKERQLGLEYGKNLENTQESYARRGLAFSSDRENAEKKLTEGAQTALSAAQQDAIRSAEDIGIKGERILGSSMFPQTAGIVSGTQPITNSPGVYGFNFGNQSRQLFTPRGGVSGTLPAEQYEKTAETEKYLTDEALKNQSRILGADYLKTLYGY